MSFFILALYGYSYLDADAARALIDGELSLYAVGAAGVTAIISAICYTKELSGVLPVAIVNYFLIAITTFIASFQTDYKSIILVTLWSVVALFAPLFAWIASGPVLLAIAATIGWYFYTGVGDYTQILLPIIATVVPFVIGWLSLQRVVGQTENDRIYHELRNKLSSVSSQSEAMIAAISNGIISVDTKNIITLINPAATKLIGWNKEDAVGLDYRSVLKLHDARDQPVVEATHPIQLAMTSGKEVREETMQIVSIDSGKRLQASITATPIPSGGVITVFRDITEERASEREQAEFISTASHEMRTPVASIEGFLGLAMNPATAQIDQRAMTYITKAHESAQHLGRLFQDLLDVSKADDGRLQNNPKVVDVVPFLHDIVTGLLPKAQAKSLFVNFKPNPDFEGNFDASRQSYGSNIDHATARVITPAYYVNVDNDHLREVLDNLVENAIKYTLHGNVTVDVTGDDEHVIVSIADSGIGIPAEDVSHLFQKFYRVDNSDTREIGGTGLGLYLCRRLTEAMGGKIWVESVYKEGSTFFVQLPRMDSVKAQEAIESSDIVAEATPEIISVRSEATAAPSSSNNAAKPEFMPALDVAAAPVQQQTPTTAARPPLPAQSTTAAPAPTATQAPNTANSTALAPQSYQNQSPVQQPQIATQPQQSSTNQIPTQSAYRPQSMPPAAQPTAAPQAPPAPTNNLNNNTNPQANTPPQVNNPQ